MPDFANRITRSLSDKLGEQPSVLDFIPEAQHAAVRAGTASANLTSAIQSGLNAVASAGGGVLYLPWGVYPVLDLTVPANVVLCGDGAARSILKRFGNLPAGRGVLNFSAAKSGCAELAIDGQVTTPATALYSSLSDPSASLLITNSSIRIHPGASDIILFRCRIFHTGGYAVHIDARTAHVNRVRIIEPDFHDNRSFLFGATAGSEIYGSWTGGILAQGDGLTNNFAVRGLTVRDGQFRRGTGNQVWSHLYGFGVLHSDFKIQGCTFEDIGRDGIMMGGVVGGDVSGNFFRRIGYVCTDDVSAGVPRWINGQWAVGLDTAGLTRGVNYRGNSFVSCYGAAMDLDGFAEGVVSDNTVIVPVVGEPEYTEDAIASWAGNYCYGAQTSNTNNLADAAVGVRVTGNRFRNCGLGAIRMYASRRGSVSGNTIEHSAGAAIAPIVLGNIGGGANQRAHANTVTENDIHYSPASPVGVVQEDSNGFNFQAGDVNRVFGNRLHGTNIFEFFRHSSSGSRTAQEFASAKSGLTAESKNILQREDGYWRTYWVEAGASKVVSTLIDRVSLPASAFGGPLHNVSVDGVGGVFSTGARTTSAFDDAMLSSKLYADGFVAIAATTFSSADANVLADTVGLIRYNATTKAFEQSTSASAGARVWAPFEPSRWSVLGADIYRSSGRVTIGSSLPGSLLTLRATTDDGLTVTNNTQTGVYFVSSYGGPTIGSTSTHPLVFLTNNADRGRITDVGNWLIGANTDDASGARLQIAGFARATVGFSTPATNTDAIQATVGGVTARFLIGTRSLTLVGDTAANAGVSGLGQGRIYFDSTANRFRISENGGVFQDLTGAGVTSLTGTANQVNVSASTGAVTLSLPQNIHSAASPVFGGLTVNGAVNVNGASNPAVFGVLGGATQATSLATSRSLAVTSIQALNTSGWLLTTFMSSNSPSMQVVDQLGTSAGNLSLQPYGGFIGIGTPSPAYQAHIHGAGQSVPWSDTGNKAGSLLIHDTTGYGGALLFSTFSNNGSLNNTVYPHCAIKSEIFSANQFGRSHLVFLTRTFVSDTTLTEKMRITMIGNVLIASSVDDNSGAKLQINGFARAVVGFSTPSTNTDAIQAIDGGVTARFLIGTRSLTLTADTEANAGLSGAAQGRIYFDSATNRFRVSENGTAYINLTGTGVTSLTGTANQVNVSASTGAVTLSLPQNLHTGAQPTFDGLSISTYLYTKGAAGGNGSQTHLPLAGGDGRNYIRGGTVLADGGGNVLVATTSDDGSGARLQVNSFIRAITGFATPSANTDAIQAPSGGVTARFLIGTRSLTLVGDTAANAGVSGLGQGRIYFDSTANRFRISENGGVFQDLTGAGVTSLTGTANQVNVSASTGAVTLSLPQNIHSGANVQFNRVGAGIAPLYTFHSINYVDALNSLIHVAANSGGSADGVYILDDRGFAGVNSGKTLRVLSRNDGGNDTGAIAAFETLTATVLRIGINGNVLVNTPNDDGSGAKLQVAGFVRSTDGFATPSANTDAIQAPSGGVTARFLIGTRSLTLVGDTAANAGVSGLGQGRIYFDSTANRFRISENGGAFQDLTGAGVTSLTGTANQVNVSASTGAVTLSLPQNIHTGASPTFASVLVGGNGTYGAGAIYSDFNWGMIFRAKQASPAAAEFRWATAADTDLMKLFSSGVLWAAGYQAVGSAGTGAPTTGGGVVYVRDTGGAPNNGGGVVFGADQGFWAGIKGHIEDGTTNTRGSLAFYTRNAISDSSLTERMRITFNGNVLVGSSTDDSSGARVQVTGFVRATTGFATPSANTDAIQAPSGGVTARFLIGTRSLTLTADTAANAGLSSAGQGRIFYDSSTNKFRVSENGGAYVDLASGNYWRQSAWSLGNFDEWPTYVFARDGSANWDEGIIKGGSNRSKLGAVNAIWGPHLGANNSFGVFSTGFDNLFEVRGGSGNVAIKGSVSIGGSSNPAVLGVLGGATQATSLATSRSLAAASIQTLNTSGWLLTTFMSGNFPSMQVVDQAGTSAGNLHVMPYGGNVGIGTSSAANNRLHIVGGSLSVNPANAGEHHAVGGISIVHGGASFANRALQIYPASDNNPGYAIQAARASGNWFWWTYGINTDNSFRLARGADSITGNDFVITAGGNVGIGTASPTVNSTTTPRLEVVGSTRTTWGHGQNALFILPAANNAASTGDAGLYLWISEPGHTWTGAGIGRNMYNSVNWPRVNSALTAQMIRFDEGTGISFTSESGAGTRYYPLAMVQDRVYVATHADDGSGAKLQVNGFVRAITGFATPASATDALQAPTGGVTARFLIGTRSLTLTADTAANAGLSASAQGRIYFDSGTNRFRVSENGGAYVDLLGAGVSSLAGTANQVNVSASTGAVTLSLPQNIHTGASPTFAGVTAGAFSATASGASIGFQTSNFNFQVDGNGNISGSGSANLTQGFRVGGTFVIDSSRNATNLASATAAGVFQSQASGGNIAFQTTNFNFQVNGNGVVSSAGGINVSGVTCINTSRQFVGYGVDVSFYGVSAGGYNVYGGYTGQTWNVVGSFTINGTSYTTLIFRGGILVSAS